IKAQAEQCPIQLASFRQSDVWYGKSGSRILIEAKSACGSKYGDVLDLSNVTLSVFLGRSANPFAVLHATSGFYDTFHRRLMVGESQIISGKILSGPMRPNDRRTREISSMSVDLVSGELRSPGMRLSLPEGGPRL